MTQPGGAITAGSLLLAGGSFALGSANNSVGTLAAAVANLNLTVGPTLTVGTAADSSNVVIAGAISFGTVNLTSTSGGITLATPINVPEEFGPVSLTAAGDIVQQSGAAIDATNLSMNSTGGGIVLGAPIDATGTASFAAGGGAGILQQTGANITTQAGLTMTTTTGPITLGALIDSAGPVSLTAAGDIAQQSGAAINATNLGMNSTGGGIALGAPITATGSTSFTAGGGAGILQQTGANISTQVGLTMTAATGPITLDAAVDPAGPVSLTAFGDIVEGAGARGSPRPRSAQFPPLGWSSSPPPTMSFRYPVRRRSASPSPTPSLVGRRHHLDVRPDCLGSLGGITQTGPITGQSLYAGTVMGDIILTNPNNSVAAIAGTAGVTDEFLSSIASSIGRPLPPGIVAGPGTFQFYDSSPNLSIGAVNFYASVVNNTPVLGSASGIAATAVERRRNKHRRLEQRQSYRRLGGSQLELRRDYPAGGDRRLHQQRRALRDRDVGGNWQVYSASPSGDVFDNLNSGAAAVWDTRFGQPVTATGDRYVFAFQPTITVTSGDLTKTYGQDVTSQVASDYTITRPRAGRHRRVPRRLGLHGL